MHSIEQYGFILVPSEDVPEEQYLLLKRNIEIVCKKTEKASERFDITNACFGLQLEGNLFATVKLLEGKAFFGLYDAESIQIKKEVSASVFIGFSEKSFERLESRCLRMIEEMSKGREFPMGRLNEAWERGLDAPDRIFIRRNTLRR